MPIVKSHAGVRRNRIGCAAQKFKPAPGPGKDEKKNLPLADVCLTKKIRATPNRESGDYSPKPLQS